MRLDSASLDWIVGLSQELHLRVLLPRKLEQVLKPLEAQDGPPVPKAVQLVEVPVHDWCC